jgi:hypothetical protein
VTVPADPGRHDSTELPDEESPEVDS